MINAFVKWLSSPLSDWHTMQLMDRLLVGAAGVGVGYYLYRKNPKMPKWKIAGFSLGASYAAAMLINAARKFEETPQLQAPLPVMPPPSVESNQATPVDSNPQVDENIPDEIMDEDEDLEGIFD
jgi:alpha/beta superfamily hydrolase